MKQYLPRSLAGQLIALTIAGLVVTQTVMVIMFARTNEQGFRMRFNEFAINRMADVAHLLRNVDPAVHDDLLASFDTRRVRVTLGPTPPWEATGQRVPHLEELLRRRLIARGLTPGVVIVFIQPRTEQWRPSADADASRPFRRGDTLLFSAEIGDGLILNGRVRGLEIPRIWHHPVVLATVVTALVLVVVLVLASRRISEPLRELAWAADRLGVHAPDAPIAERGPEDVRATIAAFNRMNRRLSRMMSHQRRMLAAVGHDLRTPLTALRLRTEFIEDADNREHMQRILDELHSMTEGMLSLVRETSREEAPAPTDITALVESICADFADLGADVTLTGAPARQVARIRMGALARALRNLIENAVRYGERARVSMTTAPGGYTITVDDDGPGIASNDLEKVFEPFVRLEESRSQDTGGLGLGLAIARGLVEGEGGTLSLSNRADGLRATMTLPGPAPTPRPS